MKLLFILLFPLMIFAQTINFPDSITTKTGKTFPCQITDINERDVSFIYEHNISLTTYYASVQNLFLKGKGMIYESGKGFTTDIELLQNYVKGRNELSTPKQKPNENDISEFSAHSEDNFIQKKSSDENRWSFGVTYVPYYLGKILEYYEGQYGNQLYSYVDNSTVFEGQFAYAVLQKLRITLDVSYHTAFEKLRQESHSRYDNMNSNDNGSESSNSLKLFNFTLGIKYYFTKFLSQKVSAYLLAGAGKQFASYNDEHKILFVEPSPVQTQSNQEEFNEDLNSPWHLTAGFGAEYSFNESLSIFSSIRVLYHKRSAELDSRTIQPGYSSSSFRQVEDSETTTRIGLGLNFYF